MDPAYQQFVDRITAEAGSGASTGGCPPSFAWLVGDWDWYGQMYQFRDAPFGITRNSSPFLIHSAAAGLWLLVLMEPGAYGLLIGRGPHSGEVRFSGDVTVSDEPVRLRQTWRIHSDSLVTIENERQTGSLWQRWDRSQMRRISSLDYSGATGIPAVHTEPRLPPSTPD